MNALRLDDNMTDQDVAEEGEDDDEGVRRDEQGFHRRALRLCSGPAPVHKALPVGQAVIIPGKETRHVRDDESLLQAPIEGQLSWGHKGDNQVGEGELDKTGQHLWNAALLLQFGKSSFARAELAPCAGRAALASLSPGGCKHGTGAAGAEGCSCLPQRASLPLSSPLLLLLQPALYPQASSEPGSSAVIGLHDIICALTWCFPTQLRSPGRYSEVSISVRKAKSISSDVRILFLYHSPAHANSVLFIHWQHVCQLCCLPGQVKSELFYRSGRQV